ncbi:hypothetical protein Tco_0142887, partial [Tanacetum coccineum]
MRKLAHGMDYMETEEAVNEGRQSNETEELNLDANTEVIAKEKGNGKKGVNIVSTTRPDINTAMLEVHTANAPVSTAGVTISTINLEVSAVEPRTPPTTTSIFDDEDITMVQTLIKMKEEKAKEKEWHLKMCFRKEPEPAKKMTRSDFDAAQIARDVEIARQLQVEVERERQRE